MKNIFKFLAAGFLSGIMAISCSDDFLEVQPYGTLSEPVLLNEQGLDNLLIGAYSGLANGTFRTSPFYLKACDDFRVGTETGASGYDVFITDPTNGYQRSRWQQDYSKVRRTNEVLNIIPKVVEKDLISSQKAVQVEAEARFLRGYFYFQLWKWFRNVPWIDETIDYSERNFFVPNTTDIYPNIVADLQFAADNLTETKPDIGRANKWAAMALLGRVYLFQDRFNDAKLLFDDIIANGHTSNGLKYQLQDEYNLNFIQRGRNSSEAVFAVQMHVSSLMAGNGNPYDRPGGPYGTSAHPGWGWWAPTFDGVDAFQTDPETGLPLIDTYIDNSIVSDYGLTSAEPFTPYQGTLDPRLDWSVGRRGIPYRDWGNMPGKAWVRNSTNSGPYISIKHVAEQATVTRDRVGAFTNNPYNIIRFADVLLMAAECEVEIGSLARAEELVNIVRARAANPEGFVKEIIGPDDPLAGFTDEPAANYYVGLYDGHFEANGQAFARKAVRFERRLELFGEHHRPFDLIRYDGNDFDVAQVFNSFFEREAPKIHNTNNNYWVGEFVRNKCEYLPIPQQEIDLSVVEGESVLVQNPGW